MTMRICLRLVQLLALIPNLLILWGGILTPIFAESTDHNYEMLAIVPSAFVIGLNAGLLFWTGEALSKYAVQQKLVYALCSFGAVAVSSWSLVVFTCFWPLPWRIFLTIWMLPLVAWFIFANLLHYAGPPGGFGESGESGG